MVNLTEFINKWKGKLCIAKKKSRLLMFVQNVEIFLFEERLGNIFFISMNKKKPTTTKTIKHVSTGIWRLF